MKPTLLILSVPLIPLTLSTLLLILLFNCLVIPSVFAIDTDLTGSDSTILNDVPLPKITGLHQNKQRTPPHTRQYRRAVLDYYYSANTHRALNIKGKPTPNKTNNSNINRERRLQKAMVILKKYSPLQSSEDRAIMGLLYLSYSQFFTGMTRTYYLSKGILLLNLCVKKYPQNLRLRFIRLLGFSKLPTKFYNVTQYQKQDADFIISDIKRHGKNKIDKELQYLYYRDWKNLLTRVKP